MEKLADEVRDLKRAYCEVMQVTNGQLASLGGLLRGCEAALWFIVVLLAVGLWRVW